MPSNSLIKRSLNLPLILLLFIVISGCSAHRAPLGDREDATAWTTLYGGYTRTGFSRDALKPPFDKNWSKKIRPFERFKAYPGEQLSTPVIMQDSLYVGSTNKKLYAFNALTGKRLWKYATDSPIESTPAVAEKMICVGTSKGSLNCLDRATGDLLWSFKTNSEVISSPVITSNTVYFYSSDDRLFALDRKSGKEIWSYRRSSYEMVTARSRTSPALSADGELILQVFSDGTLVCLKAFTGKVLWEEKIFKPSISTGSYRLTPAIDGDTVFVPSTGLRVQSRLISSGRVLKTYDEAEASSFVLAGKKGLLITSETDVTLLDRESGDIIWKNRSIMDKGKISAVSVSGETVLVLVNTTIPHLNLDLFTSKKGHIIAMDLNDGSRLWTKKLSSTLTSGVSTFGGSFALLTNKGFIEVWSR